MLGCMQPTQKPPPQWQKDGELVSLSACQHRPAPSPVRIENRLERRDLLLSAQYRCRYIFLFANIAVEWLGGLCMTVSKTRIARLCLWSVPAGSLRCDRFVKSSLASSMVGFIKGGSFELLGSARASSVVSIFFVCHHKTGISQFSSTIGCPELS
jgi:hypothetical protein